MHTPSHLILTAALRKGFRRIPMVKSAVLLGSVAPDIPLAAMSIGAMVYFRRWLGWPAERAFSHIYKDLFYEDPFWIMAHNALHAPLLLLLGLWFIRVRKGPQRFAASWWTWFLAACLLHSFVDVLTHNDDGPLLLFPLNWSYRFASPISYWDDQYFGREFFYFEAGLNVLLLLYLFVPVIWRQLARLVGAADRPSQNVDDS